MALEVAGRVGPIIAADGSDEQPRLSRDGSVVAQDSHGRYQEAVLRGNLFALSVSAGAATAFVGGAAGTPLISIYNPAGSGRNLVVLHASVAGRVSASAAGSVGFNFWGGVSAANTGTLTVPVNMYTLQKAGSVALGSSNAATTSTTAISANGPLLNVGWYYWATAAAAALAPIYCDVGGLIVCAPGNLVALGGTAALTSATYDVSMIWEEVSI
jgi:hypothetical protein